MGPRVREDDKIRDRKRLIDRSYKEEVGITKIRQDASTALLSNKHSAHCRHTTSRHSRAHGKPFIRTRQVPRFENALTATNNKNNDNAVVIPTHNTRYTMGPRLREDDKIRDRKGLIDRSYKEEVGISKDGTGDRTTPLSHKRSAHRHHTTCRHSRAHGKPFIHERRMPRLEIHLPQQPLKQTNSSHFNKAIAINHSTRCTMSPLVREDDKNKKRKNRAKFSGKEQKTQHTASTPPGVIPVHTGNHLSAHAGCRVLKMHSPHHGSPHPRG